MEFVLLLLIFLIFLPRSARRSGGNKASASTDKSRKTLLWQHLLFAGIGLGFLGAGGQATGILYSGDVGVLHPSSSSFSLFTVFGSFTFKEETKTSYLISCWCCSKTFTLLSRSSSSSDSFLEEDDVTIWQVSGKSRECLETVSPLEKLQSMEFSGARSFSERKIVEEIEGGLFGMLPMKLKDLNCENIKCQWGNGKRNRQWGSKQP